MQIQIIEILLKTFLSPDYIFLIKSIDDVFPDVGDSGIVGFQGGSLNYDVVLSYFKLISFHSLLFIISPC